MLLELVAVGDWDALLAAQWDQNLVVPSDDDLEISMVVMSGT